MRDSSWASEDGVQVGLAAAVFAQFDRRSASFDLINADCVVGIPVTIRRGATSARVRLYHQSSHVGDEFLLRDDEFERENLSFESLEVLLSRELGMVAHGGAQTLRRTGRRTAWRRWPSPFRVSL